MGECLFDSCNILFDYRKNPLCVITTPEAVIQYGDEHFLMLKILFFSVRS